MHLCMKASISRYIRRECAIGRRRRPGEKLIDTGRKKAARGASRIRRLSEGVRPFFVGPDGAARGAFIEFARRITPPAKRPARTLLFAAAFPAPPLLLRQSALPRGRLLSGQFACQLRD